MIQRNVSFPSPVTLLPRVTSAAVLGLCATLLGCSDDSINMGEGVPLVDQTSQPLPSGCAESGVLEGDVFVESQEELDALEGCQAIEGDLFIRSFNDGNVRALHALTRVSGKLTVGEGGEAAYETWLTSLEGLEALESAGSLSLHGILVEDLQALASLRTLTSGWLLIAAAPNLKSLAGLQSLSGVTDLSLAGVTSLMSLDGLTLPEDMRTLRLGNADLRELKPLGVSSVSSLELFDTHLSDLSAFAGLIWAEDVQVLSNRELQSLAGLDGLGRLVKLTVQYNGALTDLPDFESVREIESLSFVHNPLLAKLPAFPSLQSNVAAELSGHPEESLRSRPESITLYEMDALTTFTMPAGLASASIVKIAHNANLRQIEFTGQSYIEYLLIQNNPQLESISTGVLDKVNVLTVAENPLLPDATFDGVRRLDSTALPSNEGP